MADAFDESATEHIVGIRMFKTRKQTCQTRCWSWAKWESDERIAAIRAPNVTENRCDHPPFVISARAVLASPFELHSHPIVGAIGAVVLNTTWVGLPYEYFSPERSNDPHHTEEHRNDQQWRCDLV